MSHVYVVIFPTFSIKKRKKYVQYKELLYILKVCKSVFVKYYWHIAVTLNIPIIFLLLLRNQINKKIV